MISGPALRKACSENMISSTAAAKPPPAKIEKCSCSSPSAGTAAGAARTSWARRKKIVGTMIRPRTGAATIPIATADWPLRMPTATSTANRVRKHDSERIRPTNMPNRWLPARKPRAK